MSFSREEQAIIDWSVKNGKTVQEMKDAVFRFRNTGSQADPSKPIPTPKVGAGFVETIKDIPSDIGEAFKGSVEAVSTGMETAEDVRTRVEGLETTPAAGTLQTIGAGLGAGLGVAGQGFMGLVKSFLSPEAERKAGEKIQAGAERVVESVPVQFGIEKFKELSPEQQRNVQAGAEVIGGITAPFGFAPILSKVGGVISKTARASLEASDVALQRAKTINLPKMEVPDVKQARSLINDIRFQLSDLDPQVETILQRSSFDDVNRYFQQARTAKVDPAKSTPLELAGNKATEAYDVIDEARKHAVQGKKAILERVATQRVAGNTINEVMSTGIQRMNSRFGAEIDAKGVVSQAKGRTLQIDAADQKLISEYFSRLNSLGVSPTVKQVDDFVDWAQGQLYKQSKSISKFEVASEPVVRELQSITGNLNSRLKETVGGGYGEVNARVSRLIELQDEVSRALGADARKGGGLMKRLFSPTGGDTRRIFEEIQQETGIDLVKEATLAKFAMEGVDDVRQKSLLQQLDVSTQIAAELDLTKPLSIIRFIRERSDMDAQELANEVMRRARASSSPTP